MVLADLLINSHMFFVFLLRKFVLKAPKMLLRPIGQAPGDRPVQCTGPGHKPLNLRRVDGRKDKHVSGKGRRPLLGFCLVGPSTFHFREYAILFGRGATCTACGAWSPLPLARRRLPPPAAPAEPGEVDFGARRVKMGELAGLLLCCLATSLQTCAKTRDSLLHALRGEMCHGS